MAEASATLASPQIAATVAPSFVVATAARRTAIKEVKRQMQAQGVKVGLVPYRESVLQAEQYLAQHRAELIPETHAMVLGSPTLGHSTSESNASAIDWLNET